MTNHPNRSQTEAYIHGIVIRESEKALQVSCKLEEGDEPVSGGIWFPRSQIELVGPVYEIEAERNPTFAAIIRRTDPALCVFKMPVWLARKSKVCFGTRL